MKTGKKMGRPSKFSDAETLQKKIDEYFIYCEEKEEIPDVEGLVVFLDFADRSSLIDYERKSVEFFHTIKKAKTKIFAKKKQLAMRGKMNAAVYIFDAKNNHGYVEKIENDVTVTDLRKIKDDFKSIIGA